MEVSFSIFLAKVPGMRTKLSSAFLTRTASSWILLSDTIQCHLERKNHLVPFCQDFFQQNVMNKSFGIHIYFHKLSHCKLMLATNHFNNNSLPYCCDSMIIKTCCFTCWCHLANQLKLPYLVCLLSTHRNICFPLKNQKLHYLHAWHWPTRHDVQRPPPCEIHHQICHPDCSFPSGNFI